MNMSVYWHLKVTVFESKWTGIDNEFVNYCCQLCLPDRVWESWKIMQLLEADSLGFGLLVCVCVTCHVQQHFCRSGSSRNTRGGTEGLVTILSTLSLFLVAGKQSNSRRITFDSSFVVISFMLHYCLIQVNGSNTWIPLYYSQIQAC